MRLAQAALLTQVHGIAGIGAECRLGICRVPRHTVHRVRQLPGSPFFNIGRKRLPGELDQVSRHNELAFFATLVAAEPCEVGGQKLKSVAELPNQ